MMGNLQRKCIVEQLTLMLSVFLLNCVVCTHSALLRVFFCDKYRLFPKALPHRFNSSCALVFIAVF
jgi:hypothetical protein